MNWERHNHGASNAASPWRDDERIRPAPEKDQSFPSRGTPQAARGILPSQRSDAIPVPQGLKSPAIGAPSQRRTHVQPSVQPMQPRKEPQATSPKMAAASRVEWRPAPPVYRRTLAKAGGPQIRSGQSRLDRYAQREVANSVARLPHAQMIQAAAQLEPAALEQRRRRSLGLPVDQLQQALALPQSAKPSVARASAAQAISRAARRRCCSPPAMGGEAWPRNAPGEVGGDTCES